MPRDADQQEEAGVEVAEPAPGDLVTYGEPADHIAFWLGDGRILHSTGREDGIGVVEEAEPNRRLRKPRGSSALGGSERGTHSFGWFVLKAGASRRR